MALIIKVKQGTSAPATGALSLAELGFDTTNGKLYVGKGAGNAALGISMDGHTHDDRYFTESEVTTLLGGKEPTIAAGTTAQYWRGDKTWQAMPTSLPASDVYAWAKASTKPTYTYSEVGAASSGHSHGALGNTGLMNGVPVTVANGDYLAMVDASNSWALVQSNIAIGTDPLQFLSNAGSWQKPIVRDVLTSDVFVYNTTYIDSGLDVTLEANSYYQVQLVGSWGRMSSATASALRCSWTVDNTTGGPTHKGWFQFGALDSSTALTLDVVQGYCSLTAGGTYNTMQTASATTLVAGSPLGGFISVYTGTSAKVLKLRIAASVTTADGVYLPKGTSLVAVKVG